MAENYIIDDILDALDALAEKHEGSIDHAPEDLRAFGAVYSFSCELANGGLAQFLWDNLEHWESMLDEVKTALHRMNATEQSEALKKFHALCQTHAKGCQAAIEKAEASQDVKYFFDWYRENEGTLNTEDEGCFAFEGGLGDLLENWAESHEPQLRATLRKLAQQK